MQDSLYSAAVERALAVAIAAHADQRRKGNGDPYAVHPVHIALLLARLGLDDIALQAALLHDVVEDCEGWSLAGIEHVFGAPVAGIVAELTEDKACTWDERKRTAVEHVPHLSTAALVVKAADVLHNLVCLGNQLAERGDTDEVWRPFSGGRKRTLVQYRRMISALSLRAPKTLTDALHVEWERVVAACAEPAT